MVYDDIRHLKVLSKSKDKMIIEFAGEKIPMRHGDEVLLLLDAYGGNAEGNTGPSIITMSFDEFYKHEDDIPIEDDFYDGYITGINVIHH